MPWLYTPIAIRLVPTNENFSPQALSGVCFVNTERPGSVTCVSICHIPHETLNANYTVHAAAPHLDEGPGVTWLEAQNFSQLSIFNKLEDALRRDLSKLVTMGFAFLPAEAASGSASASPTLSADNLNNISWLVFTLDLFVGDDTAQRLSAFLFAPSKIGSSVTVRSCPFNIMNSKLFSDFHSTGTICGILGSHSSTFAYVSDVKYLENMAGAIAVDTNQGGVGFVAGNLRKVNGEGDLLLILPWEVVLRDFGARLLPELTSKRELQPASPLIQPSDTYPVFPVILTRDNKPFSWGLCVLFDEAIIVTNLHVIKPFLDVHSVKCHVLTPKSKIELNRNDITVPSKLDVAFVNLDAQARSQLRFVQPAIRCSQAVFREVEEVVSVGYGLFLNSEYRLPLVSRGHVSSRASLSPVSDDPQAVYMITTSASCWNGSSGGGLFLTKGELVGLITSNAELYLPNGFGKPNQTETATQICFCVPVHLLVELAKTSSHVLDRRIERSWALQPIHEDTFVKAWKL